MRLCLGRGRTSRRVGLVHEWFIFEYWKKVKLTTALLCKLDTDSNWEILGKKAPEPRLYCFSFQAWILAHEDGSPLNKYKGLAQIFEGAPW